MTFKANLGPVDRLLRIVLGVVLLNVIAMATGLLLYAGLIAGLFGLTTGLSSFCPIYAVLRISTFGSVQS